MSSPQILSIGRAADNSLVIDKPSVSKYHAVVTFITDHVVLLEDKNSTFGTTVDGRRIQQTIIGPESAVVLGQVEPLDYGRVLALRTGSTAPRPESSANPTPGESTPGKSMPGRDPLDFRASFAELEKVQELYLATRESIQINNPRQQARLRAAFAVVPLVGLFLGPVGIAAGVLGSAVSQILAAEFLNPSQKLIALEKEYKRNYVCPNPACQKSLGTVPFLDLAARKQCPACKARWAD